MRDLDYAFGNEHSAEWERSVQKTYKFWEKLVSELVAAP